MTTVGAHANTPSSPLSCEAANRLLTLISSEDYRGLEAELDQVDRRLDHAAVLVCREMEALDALRGTVQQLRRIVPSLPAQSREIPRSLDASLSVLECLAGR